MGGGTLCPVGRVGCRSRASAGRRSPVATSTPPALAAKAATTTIPVVFTTGSDPITFGLVASLSQPGGNLTGITRMNLQIGPKRLELLHELLPNSAEVALLMNPTNPNAAILSQEVQIAAAEVGLHIRELRAQTDDGLTAAFETLDQTGVQGLLVGPDPFFNSRIERFATLTVAHAVPTIYQYREFAAEVDCSAMEQVYLTRIARLASTLVAFSPAPGPPICRCSNQRRSN